MQGRSLRRTCLAAFAALLAIGLSACASRLTEAQPRWVATWASAQQIPEERNALPDADLEDATLRQVVRVTMGGERIRVRVSNVFGSAPLRVQSVTVARSAVPATARIEPASLREATFGG